MHSNGHVEGIKNTRPELDKTQATVVLNMGNTIVPREHLLNAKKKKKILVPELMSLTQCNILLQSPLATGPVKLV